MVAALACLMTLLALPAAGGSPPTETVVPALMVFGDSSVDVGNNNYLPDAVFRANFLPYGEDFDQGHQATGRFSDGKLVVDFIAESLGFRGSPPAYLGPEAAGQRLRIGANFASAGCGYWNGTARRYNAMSLSQQLGHYKDYRAKLAAVAGKNATAEILSQAVYIVSVGNGDLVQNYYINPSLREAYTLDGFFSLLVSELVSFVEGLYGLGARRIGVTSMPAMGCFPATINHYGGGGGGGGGGCVAWLNRDAERFIRRQAAAVGELSKEHPKLKIMVFDIYQPLVELVGGARKHGFVEATRGCCATGTSGTSIACKPNAPPLCRNSSEYVFWDGIHPSQAANKIIADALLMPGIALIS